MAELATLARPYAKAVFELAQGENALDRWSRMLDVLGSVAAIPKIRQLLDSPDPTHLAVGPERCPGIAGRPQKSRQRFEPGRPESPLESRTLTDGIDRSAVWRVTATLAACRGH